VFFTTKEKQIMYKLNKKKEKRKKNKNTNCSLACDSSYRSIPDVIGEPTDYKS